MQPDDRDKDPAVVLEYIRGRKLTAAELYDAFGMAKSTYYSQRDAGTLTTADNLIRAARHLGINPVDLLMRYGHLTVEEVNGLYKAF
jgi:hypothetical protein